MRVACDIGGTFTDLTYLDPISGKVGVTKVSTTSKDFAKGVVQSILKARFAVPETQFFVHGSTLIINALTERKGVRTGLITTKGFRDVLEIGRANRPDIYNMYYSKPKSFVPRYLRLEVAERIDYKGRELVPLDEAEVKTAVQRLKSEGVQAVAVCFLHSYANPEHEIACGKIVDELLPKIHVTLSHRITKEWREYERTNTAVLNSYIHPIAQTYLENLEESLKELGMTGSALHVMQSNGGSATFQSGKATPINLVESGPAAGVIGASHLGQLIGEQNVISLDIGGTTAKTSLVEGGAPKITTEYRFERRRDFAGYPIMVPTVDIVEIGAGGGSIAWIDNAGALKLGPISAGADPGPACYGWGGDRPTVTDANVLAGRINREYFLGGEISLDVRRAEEVMKPIAHAFEVSVEEASMGVIRMADAGMINALKLVSVRRGYDPRDFVLIAFGGGGAMHAGALMRELRVKKVIIPVKPAVFSAWGMLMADLRHDYIRTLITRTDQMTSKHLTAIYAEMEAQALKDMRAEGIAEEDNSFQYFADMRYLGQEHAVKIPLASGRIDRALIDDMEKRFHVQHEQNFTFRLNTAIELVNYHIIACGRVKKPEIRKIQESGLSLDQARKDRRRVNYDELGYHISAIYERELLPVGVSVQGPLVAEEPTSTTVVFPDQQMTRDEYGFLHIEMKSK